MYKVKRKTRKFDTDSADDLAKYDAILNDPLCSILSERNEKLSLRSHDPETKATISDDKMILVVTWERKELL